MSLGRDRVRLSFNPSESNMVDKIKTRTAELIDLCQDEIAVSRDYDDIMRLYALAMSAYEEAAMWAVKAATAAKG